MNRAKFIFEKFSEDSDPIHDLGIGLISQIEKYIKSLERTTLPSYDEYLVICAKNRKYEYVDFLLDIPGINVNYREGLAFRWLAHTDNAKMMKKFIDKGVYMDFSISGVDDGETALLNAIQYSNFSVVKLLVDEGAKIRKYDVETAKQQMGDKKIYNYLKQHSKF